MKKLTKSILVTLTLSVFIMTIHLAEIRSQRAIDMSDVFSGLNQIYYPTVVMPMQFCCGY